MQLIGGQPAYTATDLVGHLACEHLTALHGAPMAGLVRVPHIRGAELEVLRKRGLEHERQYLDELRAQGRQVVSIEPDPQLTSCGHCLRHVAMPRGLFLPG